jgi:hypothetical protein
MGRRIPFSIPWEVKISLFKGLSLLLKLILDKNSTMVDQHYARFVRKKLKYGINQVQLFFLRINRGKSKFEQKYLSEFIKNYVNISYVHQDL